MGEERPAGGALRVPHEVRRCQGHRILLDLRQPRRRQEVRAQAPSRTRRTEGCPPGPLKEGHQGAQDEAEEAPRNSKGRSRVSSDCRAELTEELTLTQRK